MKYLYLLVVMVMVGCSDKSPKVEKDVLPENTAKMVKVEATKEVVPKATTLPKPILIDSTEEVVVKAPELVNVVDEEKKALSTHETVIDEPKVTKNIGANVPSSCVMWSDGCNVCTRQGRGKASCTTNPECHNKVFSCLQWQ